MKQEKSFIPTIFGLRVPVIEKKKLEKQKTQSSIYIQGSRSGGGHVPPGGDASRMTTTDDEVFMQKVYIGGMRSGKNVDNIR